MRGKSCLWSLLLVLGVILGVVVVAVIGLMIYEGRMEAVDLALYPAPGRMVDVGGHSLHLYCTGEGSPTVILEAGGGSFSLDWSLVQPEVAKSTRVCSYDRAGLGWSEPGPLPRSAGRIVSELHAMLQAAGEQGPYVMVGHSFGGMVVRLYAARYPGEIAGLVLVDAAYEYQWERLGADYAQIFSSERASLQVMTILTRLGLLRLLGPAMGEDSIPSWIKLLPQDILPARLVFLIRSVGYQTTYAEYQALKQSIAELKVEAGSLGDLPVVVMTSRHSIDPDIALGPINLPEDRIELLNSQHVELQAELAQLSTRGQQVVEENSNHALTVYVYQSVVAFIQQVVGDARQ